MSVEHYYASHRAQNRFVRRWWPLIVLVGLAVAVRP
jgi:hypothetical protein